MKTIAYVAAAYLAVVGLAEIASNTMQNSPTLDTIATLPSAGSIVAKSSGAGTQAGIDLVGAVALWYYAKNHL